MTGRVDVVLYPPAVLIDDPGVGVTGDQRRIGVKGRDTAGEILGGVRVVMGGPLEVLAGGKLDADVEVAARAEVALVAVIPDAGIVVGVVPADGAGGVGGGVVAQDELEIAERLGEQRVDGLPQIAFAVEDRQADADPRQWSSRGGVGPSPAERVSHVRRFPRMLSRPRWYPTRVYSRRRAQV